MHFSTISLVILGESYFYQQITCFTILLLHFFFALINFFFFALVLKVHDSTFFFFLSLFYDSHCEEYSFGHFYFDYRHNTHKHFDFHQFYFYAFECNFFSVKIPDFSTVIFFFLFSSFFFVRLHFGRSVNCVRVFVRRFVDSDNFDCCFDLCIFLFNSFI